MYDSTEELLVKLHLTEDSTIEWKEVRIPGDKVNAPSRDDFADELAAFANWASGVVVLGVNDKTREVIGIPREKLGIVEQFIRNVCNDSIKPSLPVTIIAMELPDPVGELRAILKIDVPKSLFDHESPGGYFFRQGSEKRKMAPELLARLFQQRSQARIIRFDEQCVPSTALATLDTKLVAQYVNSDEAVRDALRKLAFIREDDQGEERATVGGILFCTPDPTKWLKNAYIDAVVYRGLQPSPNYQADAKLFKGPLNEQIEQAFAFCQRHTKMEALKTPRREEHPQFSERAVFEAIVNAVAHRDYSISGSHIRLFMYDDRLEIYSPGGLPNTMTVESMERRQATRNELIASILSRIPVPSTQAGLKRQFVMDKRGWGVPAIMAESQELSGRRPTYELVDQSETILTIYAAVSLDPEVKGDGHE